MLYAEGLTGGSGGRGSVGGDEYQGLSERFA